MAQDRWVEVSPSQFSHETEGLKLVRAIMPDETPFRAWSNFEFRDSRGRWHEVDLLLLGRGTLHLIELKYYSGTLRGDDQRWIRDGRRPEDSPLKLARRKAQYFASKLRDELRIWANEKNVRISDERDVVPFVKESVFLHHPDFRCALSTSASIDLYGLDDHEARSNLPGISELVNQPPGRRAIGPNQEMILVDLLARIGLVQRREREAGSWVIQDEAIESGDGWQDWLASHKIVQQDRARIRFTVLPASAGQVDHEVARKLAAHEFRVMSRLQHDGLLRPRDLVESDLGVGLVYPYDEHSQRLDLWLAAQPNGVPLATQLSILRQVGEALQYAHNNRVVHRLLSPLAVWIRPVAGTRHDVKVRVGDWQGAGNLLGPTDTRIGTGGVTTLAGEASEEEPGLAASFAAPEGVWNRNADRVRLDMFGLGALAFYLLTGLPPASTPSALRERLRDQQGLDVAIELPQVSSMLRSMVLKATHPSPTQRIADVPTFLALLAKAEQDGGRSNDRIDPLDAVTGTVLDGRFTLIRRLGKGSTAVGLLIEDAHSDGPDRERVLKVALDDAAADRLDDEAEVLQRLSAPRIVRLIEGPLVVGGRRALLLESAGTQTLTDVLRSRARLSLDLLERYGTDLLDALVAIDKAGVDHRDIKPANLGVREGRGDRTKHLVLFDFSLTRAAASAIQAGTPPYLDPFLTGTRDRYDSAAERYAAAVVLFEMATGRPPVYGDGESDPATITDEASIEHDMFDPALAGALVEFFRAALAREASARQHTAADLRAAWLAIFAGDATTQQDSTNDELAAAATPVTALRDSGLTARALSALEPYAVQTVGELLTVDPVRLSRMPGVANATRLQIGARIKQWRARFGETLRSDDVTRPAPTPAEAAELLVRTVTTGRSPSRGGIARLVFGFGTELDAFATHAQFGANLEEPVTQARVAQVLGKLQELWAANDEARALLDRLAEAVSARLTELGSVAAVAELTRTVLEALPPEAAADQRLARGLLRFALGRRRAMNRADESQSAIWLRRRGGVVTLLAENQELFEVAESLAAEADRLVTAIDDPARVVVPAERVSPRLKAAVPSGIALPKELAEPVRLLSLAAAASLHAAASGAGELHHHDLTLVAALEQTFAGFGGQQLAPDEIRERVRVRFPAVSELPKRPVLDTLVATAGLDLIFDEQTRVYRARQSVSATTGLESRRQTSLPAATSPVGSTGALGTRLEMSIGSRSFLALGVRADRLPRFAAAGRTRYGATVIDLTGLLLDALRTRASAVGLPWETVRAADADRESSRAGRGLRELVRQAWPDVIAAIDQALAEGDPQTPVMLTDAAPLARYDSVGLLAHWTDLAASRRRAVWLLVPQLGGNHGAVIDGRPVPLAAPNQFVALDIDWVDSLAREGVASDSAAAQKGA